MLQLPPLSLYVHLPWCVSKCPYCDFNSHAVKGNESFDSYVDALMLDLEQELPLVWGRTVHSVFLGGGTPSLFSAEQIERLLSGVRGRLPLAPEAEITLEANPGTTEHDSFTAYAQAGINRVSLGVQSFDDDVLRRIGRIHGRAEITTAIASLQDSTIENFNIDLMFGQPGQTVSMAIDDVKQAVASGASHVSHYQLTLEPNTAFHASPPVLPKDDSCWEMQERCAEILSDEGFESYEISAWARDERQCWHNQNYWRFGDYMGIGAGAHGKITLPADQLVSRRIRKRHPRAWLEAAESGEFLFEQKQLSQDDLVFEFFLNALRLSSGVSRNDFVNRTGLDWDVVAKPIEKAVEKDLMTRTRDGVKMSGLGWRFNNEVQALFLP